MTRIWKEGQPISVVCAGETPRSFVWKGRRHTIVHIARRWRLDFGWWRLRIWRDYYKTTTDTQLLAVIYHNLVDGGWYIQQIYD